MSEAALAVFLKPPRFPNPIIIVPSPCKGGNLVQEKSVNSRQKPEEEKEEECLPNYFLNPLALNLALNTDTIQIH